MKVRAPWKQLDQTLDLVSHAVSGRTALPILQHLYVEALEDSLRLVGSDLELWVECTLPAMVGEPGKATVPARLFTELIGSLQAEEITLETGERGTLWVKANGSEYHLLGLPPEEYPDVPVLEEQGKLTLPTHLFMEMVESVAFAVSRDEARAILTGIKMEYEGTTLRLVATDTHRLALREVSVELGGGVESGKVEAIVPLKAIQLIQRFPAEETYTLRLGEHRAAFESASARLVTQLIEGQYPNYPRVIPREYTRRWVLMVEEFKRAVRRAHLVARENSNKVVLRTSGEKLLITARGEGVGEALEEVEVAREGDELEIAFNARYILDVLEVLEEEGIAIELTEALRPAVFKPVERQDYLCVIMPMAL